MNAHLDKFESGSVGVSLELRTEEIGQLIERLEQLRSSKIGHFHIRCDEFGSGSVLADIEFSVFEGAGDSHVVE